MYFYSFLNCSMFICPKELKEHEMVNHDFNCKVKSFYALSTRPSHRANTDGKATSCQECTNIGDRMRNPDAVGKDSNLN